MVNYHTPSLQKVPPRWKLLEQHPESSQELNISPFYTGDSKMEQGAA